MISYVSFGNTVLLRHKSHQSALQLRIILNSPVNEISFHGSSSRTPGFGVPACNSQSEHPWLQFRARLELRFTCQSWGLFARSWYTSRHFAEALGASEPHVLNFCRSDVPTSVSLTEVRLVRVSFLFIFCRRQRKNKNKKSIVKNRKRRRKTKGL